MIRRIYAYLCSLDLGLWLISAVMLLLAAGSFSDGSSTLDELPLFLWLRLAPLRFSWWLWIAVGVVALLALNAVLCSIEALRKKGRSIAPHLMHAGFVVIVVAHLFSAYGGFKQQMPLEEGGSMGFPDGSRLRIESIKAESGPMGMMTAYHADLRLEDGRLVTIQPNHPLFHKGYGVYLKEVALQPMPAALLEIHREPGALPALLGALLFTVGNLMLLAQRRGRVDRG